MPGAALLSSLASLKAGSGMVRLLYPEGMEAELAASPYELIKIPFSYDQPDSVVETMQKAGATFVGPGLGRTESVGSLLSKIVPQLKKPCVLDADALWFYAEKSFELPPQSVMTPHHGEMQRLLHSDIPLILNKTTLTTCQEFAEQHQTTLILKGAPTFIFHPGEEIWVNPTGDPGMATAGSGDVLTGLVASLLSQGLACREAAALGVYLHGIAGEFAAQEHTSRSMIASDLITQFASVYRFLQ
jgi:NAD(P)H-hydrate epimerase